MMKQILTLCAALLLTPTVSLHAADALRPPAKPNLLLIFTDDHGYGDVSAYHPSEPWALAPCHLKLRWTTFV